MSDSTHFVANVTHKAASKLVSKKLLVRYITLQIVKSRDHMTYGVSHVTIWSRDFFTKIARD